MALRLARLGIGLGVIPTQARPAPTTAPVNTVAPSITGILTSGQTLTADPGSWSGLPGPNFTYQWKRNGTNISGATSATRVANDTDVAAGASAITVEVTATNDIGSTPATSAGVTIAAVLALTGTLGAATVGEAYSFTPTRTGGHSAYSFALTGTLPAGLSFSTSTGAITGTPSSSGTAEDLNITVTDGDGLTASLGVFDLVVGVIDADYDYLITSDADWTTVFANSDATLSGKIIEIAAGVTLTPKTISSRTFSPKLVLRGATVGTMPLITTSSTSVACLTVGDITGLRIETIDFYQSSTTWPVILYSGPMTDFEVVGNKGRGPTASITASYSSANPYGGLKYFIFPSGEETNGFVCENNEISYVFSGIKMNFVGGPVSIRNNLFYRVYSDAIGISQVGAQVESWDISFNDFIESPFADPADFENPHPNPIQHNGIGMTSPLKNFVIEGNIMCPGGVRDASTAEMIFFNGMPSDMYVEDYRIAYNLVCFNNIGSQGIIVERSRRGMVYKNVLVRQNPGTGTGSPGIYIGENQEGGDDLVRENIAELYSLVSGVTSQSNTTLANSTASYNPVFTGDDTYNPQTRADMIAKFATSIHSGVVDWDARTITRTNEHPGVLFANKTDQTVSASVSSDWSRIKGGPSSMSVSVSGGEWRSADDASGTGATSWSSSSGTVALGKYIQVRHTGSGSNSTSTTTTLTLNSVALTFQSTTIAAPSVAWDIATALGTPAITLSNSDQTAAVSTGNGRQNIRAETGMANTGKWHFEITFSVVSNGAGAGVATTSHTNQQLGGDTESIGVYCDGTVQHPSYSDLGIINAGEVVAFEYDGPNTDLYININGAGWSAAQNTAALTGDLYPAFSTEFNNAGTVILNTGGSAFAITPRSGYVGF